MLQTFYFIFQAILSHYEKEERIEFLEQTGRFIRTDNLASFPAYLGSDWCPAETDFSIFKDMYQTTHDQELKYLIDLHLWDGYGPDGKQMGEEPRSPPKSRMLAARFGETIFSPFADPYWNDPADDW